MPIRREEEERMVYQTSNSKGSIQDCMKRDQLEFEGADVDEFKEINPVYGCLVPCLKCCIYPCRAFFLAGKCISKKRRMKKVKYIKKSSDSCIYSHNPSTQKPAYNQFYSVSSNIGVNQNLQGTVNKDSSVKGNLRHPTLTGNCITPICSGSSASFCTIQAEYPPIRRSILPSSSSYGPRRYVEKIDESQILSESKNLTCYCIGNSNNGTEFEERYDNLDPGSFSEMNINVHSREINDESYFNYSKHKTNEFEDNSPKNSKRECYYKEYSERNLNTNQTPNMGNLLTKSMFSSCTPCNYSEHVSLKYSQGNCFVDN
ncbi:hypothetical protein OJ253_2229 [Cryptosporidium canis]|uniref:Uncharacterized protein n=1 Tax=Cryptosporidium canis TaxID=195482 RepID=A0A9D5DIK9_9CRYT|nr:hypothetical protein OJ253_2229 [Cryptosporidium canis]